MIIHLEKVRMTSVGRREGERGEGGKKGGEEEGGREGREGEGERRSG